MHVYFHENDKDDDVVVVVAVVVVSVVVADVKGGNCMSKHHRSTFTSAECLHGSSSSWRHVCNTTYVNL